MQASSTLLSSGIYSIPQAARLVGVHAKKLRGWVTGYGEMMKAPPLIQSEIPELPHRFAISFLNLIEARLIYAFSQQGVPVRSIRLMAVEARRFLRHPHPFATSMMFRTDRRKIFITALNKTGVPQLYDLKGKNFGMWDVLERELTDEIVYGPTGLATAWYPRKATLPRIYVHPKVSFGQPAIDKSGVPTETLYEAYLAEGNNYQAVARWFNVPPEHVKEAVQFERQPVVH